LRRSRAGESFDYFEDHRAPETVFDQFLHDWTKGRIAGPFWYDAGDKGSYPTNTAIAAWLLMNLYERYPEANASLGKTTLHEEVKLGADLMHQLILPGQKLAIAKLHTNIPSWGPCPPHAKGPCAVRVMDWILGTNAMALSMVTGFGEHAVERLHDTIVPDTEPGKMALGPNNWTNAGDPDMPPFGSLPGMKMMPVKGRGWAAREIAIDGNAPLVWMAWWAAHRAAGLLAP